jgi:hypothetical protein
MYLSVYALVGFVSLTLSEIETDTLTAYSGSYEMSAERKRSLRRCLKG